MDKKSKIALYVIGGVILLMMIAEVTKPKAINWRDSYSASDKIPLGCYVIFNELQSFSNHEVLTSTQSAFNYLNKLPDTKKATLILVNNWLNFDDQESQALMDFVDKGNSVFFSAQYLNGKIFDSLKVQTEHSTGSLFKVPSENSFSSPSLKQNTRNFKDVIENSFLSSVDTLHTTILGSATIKNTEEDSSEKYANFIRVGFNDNKNAFYIHTNPYAFTNYHMLNDNEAYTATVLSFLPKQQFIWDNYYKSGRKIVTSPIRFIISNPALKWGFYLMLLALGLFVIFKGKRTQRIIPVVYPLKNSTLDFTRTIGGLYYQNGNFESITDKKIRYFFEYVRTHFYLETSPLNQHFIEKLALKSSNTKEVTKNVIDFIIHLKSKANVSEDDLIELNKKIETFTKNTL